MKEKIYNILVSILILGWFFFSLIYILYFSSNGYTKYILVDIGQLFFISGIFLLFSKENNKKHFPEMIFIILGLLLIFFNVFDLNKYIFDFKGLFTSKDIAVILLVIFVIYLFFIINCFIEYISSKRANYNKKLPIYIPYVFFTIPFVIMFLFLPAYFILNG